MKKKPINSIALLVLFLFSGLYALKGQSPVSGEIFWENPVSDGVNGSYPSFKDANFDIEYPSIPKRCESIQIGNASASFYDVSFANLTYVTASPAEVAALKKLPLDNTPRIIKGFGQSVNGNDLSVCFYPYVLQNGVVKKVKTYTINITEKSGEAFRVSNARTKKTATTVTSSVLKSDNWYKIAIGKTGLHKITPAFLSSNGITTGSVNIEDLRIVGNGSGMLPERVGADRPEDLLEVPLQVFDQNNDGLFNGNDFAVFFASGPHKWNYNKANDVYSHIINVYRTQNFYFLSVENGNGTAVPPAPSVSAVPTVQVTSFDDYQFVEDEKVNLVGTGRQWFGDVFDFTLTYSYSFNFPNIETSVPGRLRVNAVARASSGSTFMTSSINGIQVLTNSFAAYGSNKADPYVTIDDQVSSFNIPGSGFNVIVEYNNASNPSGVAWLDFIEVQVVRNLSYTSGMLFFRDGSITGPGEVAEYTITNAPQDLIVWDVTDHNDIKAVPITFANNEVKFRAEADQLKEYVAFRGSSFPEPDFVQKVAPQDLHGLLAGEVAEMLIVSHPKFLAAAQRLADFHKQNDGMVTHVVTTEEVYNEFSSGGQDIAAIRDFAKINYDYAMAQGKPFNYLLLFGDASYDYKDRITNNSNYVPVWESASSLNLELSSITDDFYTFLDSAEGDGNFQNDVMDISVGRIPCDNVADAQSYVDKVIRYTSGAKRFGNWRNKVLLMADDVDAAWETTFVSSSEVFENKVYAASESFNVDKIYLDAYDQVSTTGSETYPEASKDMFRKVQQGNILTNYIGHGGEIGLAGEKFLGLHDVNGWTNIDAMPVFMTITCEFTRLDDPKRVSAGEQLCLNPNGGAIALISTTRVVGAGPAIALNDAVFNTIFQRPNNEPKTLGNIVRDAKNNRKGDGTRLKFSLFGDPAIKLALPYYNMQINSVNGKPASQGGLDTLKALSKVEVTGQVNDFSQQKLSNFTGTVDVSVYDKATETKTKRNDGVGPAISFDLRNSLIYQGKVEVVNGDFKFSFLVPKDIRYQFGFGKFSMYATNQQTDATGYFDTIVVGGFNNNAVADNEGPTVELYINDESFVRGGITDEDPELYAVVTDSSGINTVGNGVGHDLVAILDEKDEQSYVINEYYEADLNSYQSGKVRYPFYDLEEGEHTLRLKVFDVYNNFSEGQTEFIVAESEEFALERVLNYPNPFTNFTDFQFEHNRSDQPLEVQVQIFTVSGKLVKTINRLVVSEGNRVQSKVTWNGLDDYGDKIGKGVYVYRVKVRSQLDNSTADKYEKLVILR